MARRHRRQQDDNEPPASLYRVMQAAIGHELKARYEPEHEIPHHLFVLVMQINEERKRQEEEK